MADRESFAVTKEVAGYLRLKPGTLKAWRYLGKGPRFDRDEHGNIRYKWADVDEWLNASGRGAGSRTAA